MTDLGLFYYAPNKFKDEMNPSRNNKLSPAKSSLTVARY